MRIATYQYGLTLIELAVTMAIIAVLAAVAIPAYKGYIASAKNTEGMNNLAALELAEHEFFLENNNFFTGADTATLIANSASTWQPAEPASDRNFTYAATLSGGVLTLKATGQNEISSSVVLTKQVNAN
jgi:type IV pilus assembly protein PilE